MSSLDVDSLLREFPDIYNAHDGVVYLDSAGKSVLPKSVASIGTTALQGKSRPWEGLRGEEGEVQAVRGEFAELIGATPDCIAMCPSTAFAMSLAAENIYSCGGFCDGCNGILILSNDMTSAVYPWQRIARRAKGARIVVVERRESMSLTESILQHLDDSIAVVAVPCVQWSDGARVDVEAISVRIQALRSSRRMTNFGAPYLVVDGTQSIGAMPFDVSRTCADFVACSVHKWLLGPYGMCLMYIAPPHHSLWQPLDAHERARLHSDDPSWDEIGFMNAQGEYPETFMPGARRLDSGGRPSPVVIPMMVAALSLCLKWCAAEAAQAHCRRLTNLLEDLIEADGLLRSKVSIPFSRSQRCGHIIGLYLRETCRLHEVVSALGDRGVFVSARMGCIRVSPYLFNSEDDIHKLVDTLAAVLG